MSDVNGVFWVYDNKGHIDRESGYSLTDVTDTFYERDFVVVTERKEISGSVKGGGLGISGYSGYSASVAVIGVSGFSGSVPVTGVSGYSGIPIGIPEFVKSKRISIMSNLNKCLK